MIVLRKRVKKPGLTVVDLRAREVERERSLRVLRLVALELVQEGGQRRRDDVDHVHLQRLLRGEVRGDAARLSPATSCCGGALLRGR